MSLSKLVHRSSVTALKLPLALAWDVISLGNMGEKSSTRKVLREHQDQKAIDELLNLTQQLRKIAQSQDRQ